ncbi:thioredoxin-disulfide reductase [Treponema phagedenis]|uniref:Thioredoxin reductase n=1 Tax=Treponema phagedenis TaxID=162 RepID=A0AAE6IVC6_TREPH|nr:thioredoxin-disulfide reductase [Treponema phagedenis]NVP24355.1 thioredoxin-disulfide reductase [Treponema phagedenis]QEJ99050.1 thioredoxin-disulfide reductase [Treponema phagedenis]QEK01813.1 thioredoxin-disulfide reductase [Treponema phagedenis]QEK04561.1 thioredoxin-disulfide reductase [Treponema phagedenis]QEK10217.1 thioredoxin-disulfide reductase [Treponema phagedenis]
MKTDYDIIIIGGGAAGLTAAQYACRANIRALVIEGKAHGGQAILIDSLENYPGYADPVSGYEYAENMRKQAIAFGAEIVYENVESLSKTDSVFTIKTADKTYTSLTVVLATGAEHRKMGIPGEEEFYGKGVSYCATCDGPFFRNKHIVVVGGGDAACDEAMFLSRLTETITMVHRRDELRAQKALAERTMKNPHIKIEWDTIIEEVKGSSHVTGVVLKNKNTGEVKELACDAVFFFVGMVPITDLVPDANKDSIGYIITNEEMETSIPGLYAAGDVRAKSFRQVITASADGAIAAHSAAGYIDKLNG